MAKQFNSLFFVLLITIILLSPLQAFEDDSKNCPVSWPHDKKSKLDNSKPRKPEDDEPFVSSSRPMLSLQLLRASNLAAAGHYEEAYTDYQQGLPNWHVPEMFQKSVEGAFADCCDKIGKLDEAIEHAKVSYDTDLYVQLLVSKGLFAQAREIADSEITRERLQAQKYHRPDEMRIWLKIRAVIYCKLREWQKAVDDLKQAAALYYEDDSENSRICVDEANALIDKYKLGARFSLARDVLPSQGKEKVLAFIKMLSTSTSPLDIEQINRITEAGIKIPGETWPEVFQHDGAFPPFDHFQYNRVTGDLKSPELVMTSITTNSCCVPRDEVVSLIPPRGKKVPARSHFGGSSEVETADAWVFPTGRLFLRFGKGGARILEYIEFDIPEIEEEPQSRELLEQSAWLPDSESRKKLALLGKAIESDGQSISALSSRADLYLQEKQFEKALSDAKRISEIGGRFFLDKQIEVEEKMGDYRSAVKHMREYIGTHSPGPETVDIFSRLARLQIGEGDFTGALDSLEKAKIGAKEPDAAAFLLAQAQAGLGKTSLARLSAEKSIKYYFANAKIVLRDRVIDWLKSLPSN